MRSVKPDRKPRGNPRVKTVRKASRGAREIAKAQPGAQRRRPRARLARRPMLLLAAGLIALTLIAALFVGGYVGRAIQDVNAAIDTVMADAGFGIHEIHIAGERRTPERTIAAALGLRVGQSIFSADLTAARARLLALDWVASADVMRRYPDSIFVTLVEKRPFALWQAPPDANGEARVAVIERGGGIITTRDIEKFSRLPKLIGAGAPRTAADLIDAVLVHRAVAARIAAYERVSNRRWNLILTDGVVVKLPETDWQKQLDALEYLIIEKGVLERDVIEIDLRSPTHYFFVLKSGNKTDMAREKET